MGFCVKSLIYDGSRLHYKGLFIKLYNDASSVLFLVIDPPLVWDVH